MLYLYRSGSPPPPAVQVCLGVPTGLEAEPESPGEPEEEWEEEEEEEELRKSVNHHIQQHLFA